MDTRILSDFLTLKIKNRKTKFTRLIKKSIDKYRLTRSYTYKYKTNINYKNRFNLLNKIKDRNLYNKDVLHVLFNNIFNLSLENVYKKSIIAREKYIYRSIKYRKIRGVRLEAKDRLTRRLTAAKSIYKYRYRGSLKNLDSINNLPCTLTRGFLNSNVDYVNLNYKTRNGSFGLKG